MLIGKALHMSPLNPIRHGGHMAPQNVFYHCALTLRRRMLKLGDF